jgi:serine/threonine-protein kinase OSR1/STK39
VHTAHVLSCILLIALFSYLHINGFIHRDVKAANLLIDDDGTVLLGDLGVAADLTDDTDVHNPSKRASNLDSSKPPRIGKRKSFVGTVIFLPSSSFVAYLIELCSLAGWHQK